MIPRMPALVFLMLYVAHGVTSQPLDHTTDLSSPPKCFPTDWTHSWTRFGAVWYTILYKPGKPFYVSTSNSHLSIAGV